MVPLFDADKKPTVNFLTTSQVGKGAETNVWFLDMELIMKLIELINWKEDHHLPSWNEVKDLFKQKQKYKEEKEKEPDNNKLIKLVVLTVTKDFH